MVRAAKRPVYTKEDVDQLDPKILDACAEDKYLAIKTFFKVNDKNSDLVPVEIPEIIRKHYEASGEISLWGKGRQQYLTTSIDALFFQEMIDRDGLNVWALNLTEKKATENFKRVQDFDTYKHPALKELTYSVNNSAEIGYRETRSSFQAVTIKNDMTEAQADQVARTATCRRVRWTEASFSRHYMTVKKALLDTMPRQNRKLVIETTGNGAQGGFWTDFMQVVKYGQPHPTLPGCWTLGNVSAHFITWFQHHEYFRKDQPFKLDSLDHQVAEVLTANDKEHIDAMRRMGFKEDEVTERINWMHMVLLEEKNLLTDPHGAVRNFNREYPATIDHMFQATGDSWFSVIRISQGRDLWKKENEARRLPLYCSFVQDKDGAVSFIPGNEVMVWEFPVQSHENRYVGILDPGGGTQDGDPTAGGILDRYLQRFVAIFHGGIAPRRSAELLSLLGRWYGLPLLNWENDGLGISVTEALLDLKYPNLYRANKERTDVMAYGWNTGGDSRRKMLGISKSYFDNAYSPISMPYLKFYDEAAAFQTPPGKQHAPPAAVGGAHDDLVMMYSIGCITHHELMPPLVPLIETRKARPGEASVKQLAATGQVGAYRQAVERRRKGMKNF